MKVKTILAASTLFLGAALSTAIAQTTIDFENITIAPGTYGGTATAGDSSFTSGNVIFPNSYNGYWSAGWMYSNVKDSTTAGYTNLAASRGGSGYAQSANYVVGQNNAKIKLTGTAFGRQVDGMFINNGTYAALSMQNGDGFAKKFGGATGNDPDYFLLTIKAYNGGVLSPDSVNFYLADYRFSDNTKDYIIKEWTWVDVSSLGKVDSLGFTLNSTDVGGFGMNTPAFFCVDNLITSDAPTSTLATNSSAKFKAFPNPCVDNLTIQTTNLQEGRVQVSNLRGQIVLNKVINSNTTVLNLVGLQSGLYILSIEKNGIASQTKFIKK